MSAEASIPIARRERDVSWPVAGRGDMEAGMRRARRHSRLVRLLRFGLPAAVALGFGVYLLAGLLNPLAIVPQLQSAGLSMSGSRITMDQPRVAGFTRDGRSYELTAAEASQDLRQPQQVHLQSIRGRVQLQDGEMVEISADRGSFDTRTEVVALRENVVVGMSDGSRARMSEATIDARNGRVVSDEKVEIVTDTGQLQARRMEVLEGGNVMTFRDGVVMDINPPAAQAERRP